ncbi:MAG: nucleotide exchange factor GrpE, partial [Actinomycetota bacterium]|nr:nucleotide exchange factor GrpE [Actinomycetota bacterium]
DSALLDGVKMIYGQFLDVLEKEGLEIINPQGEPFDPEEHEAMVVVESDECPENTVVEVLGKGYKFRGFLIRPAMVKVSCLPKE